MRTVQLGTAPATACIRSVAVLFLPTVICAVATLSDMCAVPAMRQAATLHAVEVTTPSILYAGIALPPTGRKPAHDGDSAHVVRNLAASKDETRTTAIADIRRHGVPQRPLHAKAPKSTDALLPPTAHNLTITARPRRHSKNLVVEERGVVHERDGVRHYLGRRFGLGALRSFLSNCTVTFHRRRENGVLPSPRPA